MDRKVLINVGALLGAILLAIGGYVWYMQSSAVSLGLSDAAKEAYADSIVLSYKNKQPADAIKLIDVELGKLSGTDTQSEEDLYTEAKLTIYKADLLIGGMHQPAEGFALLSGVFSNPRYAGTQQLEGLLLALARVVQGLGEGSLSSADVQTFVLSDTALGSVAKTSLTEDVPEPIRVYDALIAGFKRVTEKTTSKWQLLLAQSYMVRLYPQIIEYTKNADQGYGALVSDIEQFESDLSVFTAESQRLNESYQEYLAAALYNLALAYEFLPRQDAQAKIKDLTRIREKMAAYAAHYPDDAYRMTAFSNGIGTRLVCRMVDVAKYDAKALDTAALKVVLGPIFSSAQEAGVLSVPCPQEFVFIATQVDPRLAPYLAITQ